MVAWTIAPQINQLINSSKRVATYIHQLEPQPQQALIGHNFGYQPNLPFYILQNGNNPIDAIKFPMEELVQSFNTQPKTVFKLIKTKYDLMNLYLGQTLPYQIVSTLIIDRNEISDYYIVCAPDFNQ